MKLYLEKLDKALFWEITCKKNSVIERAGEINHLGQKHACDYPTVANAFDTWITAAKTKLEEGYKDPQGNVQEEQLDRAVYEHYLTTQQFDAAVNWLNYFGHLDDPTLEDLLIDSYIEHKEYTLAEKYVLGKLQSSQDGNIAVRQIRYLTTINPMLSRFMLGNLPVDIQPNHPEIYYQELAQAQSKIAFFDTLSSQIRAIPSTSLQIIYLTHLLDNPHENNQQQILALEKAQLLLKNWKASLTTKEIAYQKLIAGAERIKQPDIANQLKLTLQQFSDSDDNN